jgi:hypothetical protein
VLVVARLAVAALGVSDVGMTNLRQGWVEWLI